MTRDKLGKEKFHRQGEGNVDRSQHGVCSETESGKT